MPTLPKNPFTDRLSSRELSTPQVLAFVGRMLMAKKKPATKKKAKEKPAPKKKK